ncbi:hypothetical protein [Phytohabitans kaempferiae]|uniref:Bacterial spore germination immunoglobulin-like domain-containing protein n=1 Tax=Phytohabitans kaempferiae TaxID=1620943 RepID=A0ABV6LYF7_9ACTN
MNAVAAGSVTRCLAGFVGVALALVAIVMFVPSRETRPVASTEWAPSGFTAVDTVTLDGDRTLRLWVSPSGWWVQSLVGGEHEGAVGAATSRHRYTASVVLDGLVGIVPVPTTAPVEPVRSVSVRAESGGTALRATVHDRVFLLPGWIAPESARAVLVTPYGADGQPLADEVPVTIAGR